MNWKQHLNDPVSYEKIRFVSVCCFLSYLSVYLSTSNWLERSLLYIVLSAVASVMIYNGGLRKVDLPLWWVTFRFVFFSMISVVLALVRLDGLDVGDGWFAILGTYLTVGTIVAQSSAQQK